ncbi:MAG: DUF349 domain-containing protein [Candidatus Ancillula sp.]|jgi:hypothetical protein|nr:DUF349 domain-containing protein [Candidatus Ancillula sp.]
MVAKKEILTPKRLDDQKMQSARKFGRVDEEGRVFVKVGDEERQVGQYLSGEIDAEMTLFVRRFVDQVGKMEHFAMRASQAANVTAPEIDESIAHFKAFSKEYNSVGDYLALQKMIPELERLGEERKSRNRLKREEDVEATLVILNDLVREVEGLVETLSNPKTPWKRISTSVDETLTKWKEARGGARVPEKVANELWERFSAARKTLQDARKAYFSSLRETNSEVKRKKDAIIKEAEGAQETGNFDAGKRTFARLMREWKELGRGDRKTDDAQWKKFNAARDHFFSRLPKEDKPSKKERPKWDNDTSRLGAPIQGLDLLAALKDELEQKGSSRKGDVKK